MNFRDLDLKSTYKSLGKENILNSFLLPTLSCSKEYRRSVGFFTLSSLVELYEGIQKISENKGRVKIVTSPKITREDFEFIKDAYEQKDHKINEIIMREFHKNFSEIERYKLSEIFSMIVEGVIEVKIVYTDSYGMYHDKLGIAIDNEDNKIVFYGSLNETRAAFLDNYEKIRIRFSWQEYDEPVISDEVAEWEDIWNDNHDFLKTMTFPEVIRTKMIEFIETEKSINKYYIEKKQIIKLRKYQEEAIESWQNNNYKGIFSMATGTGKTYTSIFAIKKLIQKRPSRYLICVTVPYLILINQWANSMSQLTDSVIKASSNENNWLEKLQMKINLLNTGMESLGIVICSLGTLKTERFQKALSRCTADIIFLGDEVHNFGTFKSYESLPKNAEFRLGLSATPKRHYDDEGSERLEEYFSGVIFEYTLDEAIKNNYLVPYFYNPVLITLNIDEQSRYDTITEKVIKLLNIENENDIENNSIDERVKRLLINRSLIVANAQEKTNKFFDIFGAIKDKHNLVYCGPSVNFGFDEDIYDEDQIDVIRDGLISRGYQPALYTSSISDDDKKNALRWFSSGEIDALVAIKCLDEGVDIPSIEKAFILASTTNPKEFIQRRGRVLRPSPGTNKEKAIIYDFVTLPHHTSRFSEGLVKRELKRVVEFNLDAINKSENIKIINDLVSDYDIMEDGNEK